MARLELTAPRRSILGMVMSGEVASVGRDVRSFKEGDQTGGGTGGPTRLPEEQHPFHEWTSMVEVGALDLA